MLTATVKIKKSEDILTVFKLLMSLYTLNVHEPMNGNLLDYVFDSGISAILRYDTKMANFYHSNGYFAYCITVSSGHQQHE